ncbi:melatonin receptor type 1B-B [Anolis carolinensis]
MVPGEVLLPRRLHKALLRGGQSFSKVSQVFPASAMFLIGPLGCLVLLLHPRSPSAFENERWNDTELLLNESRSLPLPREGDVERRWDLTLQGWEEVTQTVRTVWRQPSEVDHPWRWAPCLNGNALHPQCRNWVMKVSIVCTLGLLVAVANGTVIVVVASSVSGWSNSSRLALLSLALADAALAVLVVPLNLYLGLTTGKERSAEGGQEATSYCRPVAFVNSAIFSTSLYSLAGVSLERYVAVFFPLHYGRLLSRKRVAWLIATAWLVPVIILAPLAVPGPWAVLQVRFSSAALLCEPDYGSNMAYSLLILGTIFCPAAGLITFANLRLWMAARSQRQRSKVITLAEKGSGPKKLCSLQMDTAARILLPVVIAFYICWTPCIAIILYNSVTHKRVHEWAEFVALWLPIGSGLLNCFVYFWVNRSFRQKLQKVGQTLCHPCCKAQRDQWPRRLPTLSALVDVQKSPSPFPGFSSSSKGLRRCQERGGTTKLQQQRPGAS